MMNAEENDIAFLMIIVRRDQKQALLPELSEAGVRIMNIAYDSGSVKASYLMDTLGLVPEENKAVIICPLPRDKTNTIFDILINKFRFNEPNTGITFIMPVDRLLF